MIGGKEVYTGKIMTQVSVSGANSDIHFLCMCLAHDFLGTLSEPRVAAALA